MVATVVAGCSTATQEQHPGDGATAVSGFVYSACSSLTDAEVSQTIAVPSLRRVIENPLGCQWETPSSTAGTYVQTWWYRGSPIDVEKAAAIAAKFQIADITVGGLSAFSARSGEHLCEIVAAAGPDLVQWTVGLGDTAPVDPCDAATSLTQASLGRGLRR